jgi:hypothetical protein
LVSSVVVCQRYYFLHNLEELERFLRQLGNKFALERRHYKQNIDKIRYASLLLKGNTAKWNEAYHLHIDSLAADYIRGRHELLDASFATWDQFVAPLRSSFGSRLTRENAVREFEKLEHSKWIDTFLDELPRLIWQTGYSDDVVKDKISRSLTKELSKDWSKVLDKPDSLAGWLIRLREMGHNNERWEEQYGNSKSPPRHPAVRKVRDPRVLVGTRKALVTRQRTRIEIEDGRLSRLN